MKYLWTLILFTFMSVNAMASLSPRVIKPGTRIGKGAVTVITIKASGNMKGWNNVKLLVEAKWPVTIKAKHDVSVIFPRGVFKAYWAVSRALNTDVPWAQKVIDGKFYTVHANTGKVVLHNPNGPASGNDFYLRGVLIKTVDAWKRLKGKSGVFTLEHAAEIRYTEIVTVRAEAEAQRLAQIEADKAGIVAFRRQEGWGNADVEDLVFEPYGEGYKIVERSNDWGRIQYYKKGPDGWVFYRENNKPSMVSISYNADGSEQSRWTAYNSDLSFAFNGSISIGSNIHGPAEIHHRSGVLIQQLWMINTPNPVRDTYRAVIQFKLISTDQSGQRQVRYYGQDGRRTDDEAEAKALWLSYGGTEAGWTATE